MAVIRTPLPHSAFTMTRNCWARDRRIGYKGRGLLTYLLSHADGYKISQAQIVRESTDGREAVSTGLRELEAAGYLRRTKQRSAGRFAEDDYALADPFDADGHLLPGLPETGALVAQAMRETRQSGKPDTVTGADYPQREIRPIEEQGEENTPAPTEQGATRLRAVEPDEEAKLREKLAATLASEHYEATGRLGGSRAFLAARGIVVGALAAGHAEQQVRAALAHLRGRGRPVTNSTLGPLLADPRTVTSGPYRSAGPYRDPHPDEHRGAF